MGKKESCNIFVVVFKVCLRILKIKCSVGVLGDDLFIHGGIYITGAIRGIIPILLLKVLEF